MSARSLVVLILLSLIGLVSCAKHESNESEVSWHVAMVDKLSETANYSREKLTPYFAKANLPYAPHDLAFVIFKKSKRFEVFARHDEQSSWHYIKTYRIFAASGGPGPKLHEGDDQVPEGIYHIVGLNPRSHFDLSLHLNYPNTFDRHEAALEHRHDLGGNIFIHGERRSIGCIAIGDKAIEQLFPLVYAVGEHHVTVVIAPSDLRKSLVLPFRSHETWVSTLYARLKEELKQFPIV